MNNSTITIKKTGAKFQPYTIKLARLVSYLEGVSTQHILDMVEEYDMPFIYKFPNK